MGVQAGVRAGARLLLLLCYAFSILSTASARAEVEIYDLEHAGQRLRIALVHAGPHAGAVSDKPLEGRLREVATDFMIREYVARGTLDPVRDAEMLTQLRTTEGMKDGRSHLMIVFNPGPEGEIGEPIGIIRVASQSEKRPLLPFEERTLGRGVQALTPLKIRETKNEITPVSRAAHEGGHAHMPAYRRQTAITGASIEVKNYVVSKSAPVELSPLMYNTMENAGWLSESLLPSRINPSRVGHAPNRSPRVKVSTIYLETGEGGLHAFYKRLGFQDHVIFEDPDIGSKRTVVMKLDRPGLLRLLDRMNDRPGTDFLRSARATSLSRKYSSPGLSCPQFFRSLE